MKSTLHISRDLQLPLDIGTETIAILGRRGSGKSNTATVLMEELIAAGQQIVLIDPKGEGWGLKAQGAGGPGLDVIVFGDPEGDLPLHEEHGETIADFVVTSGRSCILSVKGLESDAAQRRFVARFTERLFNLKGRAENRSPIMVVIDEAHLFVPQRVDPGQTDVLSRVQRLVRLGRSSGIGVTLVDQRPASVNKDLLSQVELLVCHQLTSPHDRKAVDVWVDANAEPGQAEEFRRTLPAFGKGETWFWSPALLKIFKHVQVRPRNTFDSSGTPVLGKHAARRPKMRNVDLDALRGQLETVVEERKANDPVELKKKLAAAEKALVTAANVKPAATVKQVEKPVITDAQIARMEKLSERAGERVKSTSDRVAAIVNPLMELLHAEQTDVRMLLAAVRDVRNVPVPSAAAGRPATISRPATTPVQRSIGPGDSSLPKGERAVLIAIAQTAGGCSRQQLTVLTGYKRSSRDTYLQRLRERKMIEPSGDQLLATSDGVAALGANFEPLPTGDALREHWMTKLPEGERRVLEVVAVAYPEAVDRQSIEDATGYKRSSRDTYLQRLGSRGLVEVSRDGVSAAATLFG